MLEQSTPKKRFLLGVSILWLILALAAMNRLWRFEAAAGAAGHPAQLSLSQWQHTVPIPLDPVKPILILLVHPHCPCSRASVYELNRLAALCPNRAVIFIWFLKPVGYTPAWTHTDLWRQASAIPGVHLRVDTDGNMARRFGAATSGETLLYAPTGRLLYQGGLTGARGHEGDNAGLSAVAALLNGKTQNAAQEPVYGCPLTASRQNNSAGELL